MYLMIFFLLTPSVPSPAVARDIGRPERAESSEEAVGWWAGWNYLGNRHVPSGSSPHTTLSSGRGRGEEIQVSKHT